MTNVFVLLTDIQTANNCVSNLTQIVLTHWFPFHAKTLVSIILFYCYLKTTSLTHLAPGPLMTNNRNTLCPCYYHKPPCAWMSSATQVGPDLCCCSEWTKSEKYIRVNKCDTQSLASLLPLGRVKFNEAWCDSVSRCVNLKPPITLTRYACINP